MASDPLHSTLGSRARRSPNQALERTAARRTFAFQMTLISLTRPSRATAAESERGLAETVLFRLIYRALLLLRGCWLLLEGCSAGDHTPASTHLLRFTRTQRFSPMQSP
jgi:hypothetical protein